MTSRDDHQQPPAQDPPGPEAEERPEGDAEAEGEPAAAAPAAGGPLGHVRYVHAAFFAAAVLASYLGSKLVFGLWGSLTDWPAAVKALPWLLAFSEEERGTVTLGVGALIGGLVTLRYYRQERVRVWAGEVAAELAKVTWPDKQMVTRGTVVVVVASIIATIYVTLLDRFWGFVTDLVYRV